jgi:predicted RNase H-like HicB family nuclease
VYRSFFDFLNLSQCNILSTKAFNFKVQNIFMLTEYLSAAMHKAHYELLPDDKVYYGEVPGFEGVYATGTTLEECREELLATLEDWLLLSIHKNLPVPVVDNISLEVKSVA